MSLMPQDTSWNHHETSGGPVPLPPESDITELSPPPPEPLPEPLPDVDAWFAQRGQMIENLQARRKALLEEVQETDRKLRILGVVSEVVEPQPTKPPVTTPPVTTFGKYAIDQYEAARAKKRKKPARVKAKTPNTEGLNAMAAKVVGTMSKRPEKVLDIGARVGLDYKAVWRSLAIAKKHGLVKSSGIKGKDIRWSLA